MRRGKSRDTRHDTQKTEHKGRMFPDLRGDPRYSYLFQPPLLSSSAAHREIWGFPAEVRNNWKGEELDGGHVYAGICASRHIRVVLFVGENSADWACSGCVLSGMTVYNPHKHFSLLLS